MLFSKSLQTSETGFWLGDFNVLAEKIFFPMLAFPPGNETKLSPNICSKKLGETLPRDD